MRQLSELEQAVSKTRSWKTKLWLTSRRNIPNRLGDDGVWVNAAAWLVIAHTAPDPMTYLALTTCSSKMQQPRRTKPTASDRHKPVDLRQRPTVTFLPLVHTEEVTALPGPRVFQELGGGQETCSYA